MLLTPDRGNGPNMKCYSPRTEREKKCVEFKVCGRVWEVEKQKN